MSSPFPGMDPYLEQHWGDVHTVLIGGARDQLNIRLPDDLIASAQERTAVGSRDDDDDDRSIFGPDVKVTDLPSAETSVAENPGAAVVVAPIRLTVGRAEPIIERFIHVIEAGSERLITVTEFLSPTNKRRVGMRAFRRNRTELLKAGVNFVEIDLIRAGDWQALLRPHRCPGNAQSVYRATFRVPLDRRAVYLHPTPLRSALPSISIPLRPNDPQVHLDLQPLLNSAYVNSRYDRRLQLTYRGAPKPPLTAEDSTWTDGILQAAGKRP